MDMTGLERMMAERGVGEGEEGEMGETVEWVGVERAERRVERVGRKRTARRRRRSSVVERAKAARVRVWEQEEESVGVMVVAIQ